MHHETHPDMAHKTNITHKCHKHILQRHSQITSQISRNHHTHIKNHSNIAFDGQREPKGAKREPREPKGAQKATEIHPKFDSGAKGDFGCQKGARTQVTPEQKWSKNHPKIMKIHLQKNIKKTTPKKDRKIRKNVNPENLTP